MNYKVTNVRNRAVLTTSYVAGKVIEDVQNLNQMVLHIDFTKGNLASAEIKVEFSIDGVNYEQLTSGTVDTNGLETLNPHVLTIGADAKFAHLLPIKARYIKISAKGTGTVTGSLLKIRTVCGVA
jgi:hypothetical protein